VKQRDIGRRVAAIGGQRAFGLMKVKSRRVWRRISGRSWTSPVPSLSFGEKFGLRLSSEH
jgi:hypothetical protein